MARLHLELFSAMRPAVSEIYFDVSLIRESSTIQLSAFKTRSVFKLFVCSEQTVFMKLSSKK